MKSKKAKIYDVVVIGAGHAGIEASLASARMGCETALFTLDRSKIGFLSCNPAIGGIGKGQLVRELDALGGEMAKATDASAIQFRTLNASKGKAVWSTRAQVDRQKYSAYVQKTVKKQKNLKVREAEIIDLIVKDKVILGVETSANEKILSHAVIITPGTFLNGLIHIGMRTFSGGRIEELKVSKELSSCLRKLGFKLMRFKTGTCARLDAKTLNFSAMKVHHGDKKVRPFSLSTKKIKTKQMPCYITYTSEKTHKIVRDNLKHSPLFSGKITGIGVRYCPSFEDKIVKFPHHARHQIFLEPEGLNSDVYYPNGLSTSLPEKTQQKFIHSIEGLEKVKINRFGYGIEHDVVEATQLYPTLETKLVKNLYLAGQINGTTGYEEAAAQGLVAGINAVLRINKRNPFILDRSTSYIGVLLDDLVTRPTPEPYRMFTSRVEYRLLLREDNADLRLRRFGFEFGLVKHSEYNKTKTKQKQIHNGIKYLKSYRVKVKERKISLYQLLKRPEVKISNLKKYLHFRASAEALQTLEAEVKYSGFIRRQLADVRSFKHLEKIKLPEDIDYQLINGLSSEIKEKLTKFRPLTLGQANRISGITPAAIMILMVFLKKRAK